MTVCDGCNQIMNGLRDYCDECERENESYQDQELEECDHCGSRFHSTFRCDFDEYEA